MKKSSKVNQYIQDYLDNFGFVSVKGTNVPIRFLLSNTSDNADNAFLVDSIEEATEIVKEVTNSVNFEREVNLDTDKPLYLLIDVRLPR